MSRTDELRQNGATDRTGGGGGTPFVKWPQDYAYVEGQITDFWTGKYGDAVTLRVTGVNGDMVAAGKTEDGQKYQQAIETGMEVNVGLNYAALEGAVGPSDQGKHFHFAFEGWGESKSGDQYRIFAVLEVPGADDRARPGENVPTSEQIKSGDYEPAPTNDDGLPF